jgi:tetratricopeptide (TPR) repeat protein
MKTYLLVFFLLSCFTVVAQKETVYKLIKDKKYKEAHDFLNKEIAKTPDNAELYYLQSRVYYHEENKTKETISSLNKAIEKNSTYSAAYCDRGTIYTNLLMFQDGKDDIDAAIKYATTDSTLKQAKIALASYYAITRKNEQAVEIFNEVLISDSLNFGVLNNLAMVYQDMKDYDKSLEILYKLEKLKPDEIFVPVNIGFVLSHLEKYKEALEYFNKAEKIQKDALVYSNRAYVKHKLDDNKGALVDINKSIKLYPSNSYAYRVRALIYLATKNTDSACQDLYTALAYKYTEMYGDDVRELRDKYCIK